MRVIKYFVGKKYPDRFIGDVLEVGSCEVAGTVRPAFVNARTYVGVDWRPGPCVDVVSLAHKMPFKPESFDVVVSTSMLEHDPYWRESLTKMVDVLKPGGALLLTWGGKYNKPHCLTTAPDGKFHPLPLSDVIQLVEKLGIRINAAKAERDFKFNRKLVAEHPREDIGGVALMGFKEEKQRE